MSKKLAENLDRLVLDVKYGTGAFMKTREAAQSLADAMAAVAHLAGVQFSAILNPMDEPLGRAVGNALEVQESIETLLGRGPADLENLTLTLAEALTETPITKLQGWLHDGTAYAKFQQLVSAQGGNVPDLERLVSQVHRAPVITDLRAAASGVLSKFDAQAMGRACVALGGGRAKATDAIDYAVGFDEIVKCGQSVTTGDVLCRIHARTEAGVAEALRLLVPGIVIS
jgi:thymidine phosphorylase